MERLAGKLVEIFRWTLNNPENGLKIMNSFFLGPLQGKV
jgi:hypothetical protein